MKKIFFLITFLLSVCPTNAQTIKDIKGRWKGSYFCSQGETGLTMKIKPISDKEFIGTFKFYPIKTNLSPTVKSGKFSFEGTFSSADKILFKNDTWIKQPENYMMIDLAGKLLNNKTIEGKSTTYSCGDFKVRKR